MEDAVRKAEVLVEALGWIRQFRDRYIVIKLGGSTLDDPEAVRACLTDVIFMESVGMRPIIVHGGGKSINRAMAASGIQPRFVQGRRYTDPQTLEIVAHVLAEEICEGIVDEINAQGGKAIGLNYLSQNALIGERLTLAADDGEPVDLGCVGRVTDLQRDLLIATCRADTVPVLPSIAVDSHGELLNVNADTAAADVARMLNAEKLVFLSDVPGIYRDRNDPATLQTHLTATQCREMIADGTIDAGMIPKVEAGIDALNSGVRKVHIVDASIPHSLLLEVYSNQGIGTEIVKVKPAPIRV